MGKSASRQWIKVAGVIASAVVALPVALSGGSASAASSKINPDGILKYGIDLNDTFSNTFDPAKSTNDCGYAIYSNIYQSALAPANNAVLGGVVSSWSNTTNTVTLHVRPGVTFSDGTPITAQDVEDSINHIRTSPFRFTLTYIASMDVVNPSTLVLNLNTPAPGDVLWALTYIDGTVMDPANIPFSANLPLGAGPFEFVSYQQDSVIKLKANPNYWDKSAYHLGGVDFVQVSPGPQTVGALESGAIDMAAIEPENVAQVKADPNLAIAVSKSYDYMTMQMRLNAAPFNNEKVRAAIEYAVDRSEINKVVYAGEGVPAYQPWPSWSLGFNKKIGDKYSYEPAKAKAMLKAAGFKKPVAFSLVIPSGDETYARAAQIIQAEADAAGFKVTLTQVTPQDLFTEVYLHGEGDAILSEELTNGPDLANNFEGEYTGIGYAAKKLGTTDPTLIPLIDKALHSISASFQGPLMQKAGAIAMSTGTEVPIAFTPSLIAYNKNIIGGKVTAPIGQCRSDLAGFYIKK